MCFQYFPTEANRRCVFETFDITLESLEKFDHYVIRELKLIVKNKELLENNTSCERTILHFQFISWPDFGIYVFFVNPILFESLQLH